MEKGKEKENGVDQTEIHFRESTLKISKTVGVNLLGPMDRFTKVNSEMIYVMGKVLISIRMAKMESLCGLTGK